jgi:hypothetical protein
LFLGYIKTGYEANCAVFSRRKWEPVKLFDHLLKPALTLSSSPYICVAADDTHINESKPLLMTLDASFCNKTCMRLTEKQIK